MGFRIFCFFPNFSSVNLCRMTVPGEFLSAVIWGKKISIFLFAPLAVPQCPSRAWVPNESPCGLLWSFPAADLLTFLIALFFIRQTYRELKK